MVSVWLLREDGGALASAFCFISQILHLVWEWMMASMCVLNLVLSPLAVACTHPTCASSC